MDIVKFSEKYSQIFDEKIENLPSKRYKGLGKVVKTYSYEGEICVMQEKNKMEMFRDVYDAVKIASATSSGNAKFFEKTVNEFLNNLGYLADCDLKVIVEIDQKVGEKLKESFVKGKEQEIEREI